MLEEKKDKERKKFKSLNVNVPDIETLKNILQVKDLYYQKKNKRYNTDGKKLPITYGI